MPRIDPIRLLSCLKPLLNLQTGGIKSDKEVDKVFVLMTKFSKKLVSKCTYINILKATPSDVLNLFMERGGWEMLYNWVLEAKANKNHVLLNEILGLFLITPASVERLRTNSLPKEVKQISTKWDVEETKSFAEKVVAFWITIAKNEESGCKQPSMTNVIAHNSSVQAQNPTIPPLNQNSVAGGSSYDMQTLGQLSDESAINSNLTDSIIYESENPQTLDLDVDNFDINEIMDYNFNPELFTKTIDMHLGDLNASEGDKTVQIANNNANSDNNVVQQHPVHVLATTTQSVPTNVNSIIPIVTASPSPTVPRIVIKTSGGQRTVVTATSDGTQISQPIPNTKERLCYVTHNGQRFLMSLRVADNEEVSKLKQAAATPASSQPEATQDQQVTSSVSSSTESTPTTPTETKRKRPRKDPTITAARNAAAAKLAAAKSAESLDTPDQPKVLKTYSKKTNAELISNKGSEGSNGTKVLESKEDVKTKATRGSSSNTSKSSTSSSKSSSSKQSASKSRRSTSKPDAATAAEAAREEKLKLQMREQKKKVKERLEAVKNQDKKKDDDKQKQKDDQTLKDIYGASSVNAAKIPKKPKPSFTDLIGVPGSSEDTKKEKITKEKNLEGDKLGTSKSKDDPESSSSPTPKDDELKDASGLGQFSRPENKDIGPPKERRHVKVYTSSKSKNMDLLETMTKGSAKGKPKLDLEPAKPDSKSVDKGNAVSFEDAISGSSSSIKPAKRPSIDSGKSGDSKKLKLEESPKDKKEKESKDKSKDKGKEDAKKSKEGKASEKSKKPQVIQESSLFMDAINSSTREPSKIKRRRRISSNSDLKEKDVAGSSTNHYDDSVNSIAQTEDGQEKVVKPVFNFYRDTLNDDDELPAPQEPAIASTPGDTSDKDIAVVEGPDEPAMEVDTDIHDDFAPVEGEGKLKSCLCIHRPKGKPKKLLRWREEDELKEFHYFEMDETERVNVTKQGSQVNKNFSEMRLMEKSEEKLFIRRKFAGETPPVEKFEWMRPRKIDPECLSGQPEAKANSQEKSIQEERERSILEVFYFPGTILPEHPSEEYVLNLELDRSHTPRVIPADDIPVLTKVSDYRNTPWPAPRIGRPFPPEPKRQGPAAKAEPVGNMVPNPMVNVDPGNAFANPYNPASSASSFDLFNPWSQSFDPHPQSNDPWKAAQEVQNFGGFPPVPPNAVPPVPNSFQPMAFGYPFPPPQIGAVPVPMGQMPGQLQPPGNFPGFGPPMPNQFDPNQHQMPREEGPPHQGNRHPPGRPTRDVDYRDVGRRNERDRDYDRDGRNRDIRPGGSRDRDRDRDRDSRDRGRDRDRYDKDRDYRNTNDRRRAPGRRSTLCNYFAKGFCREGNKCAFLHPGVNGPPAADGPNGNNGNNVPRHKPSPPPSNNRYDDRRRSSPPTSHHRDLANDLHNSPTSSATMSSSGSGGSGAPKEIPEIQSPTPEVETRFIMPPSSPNESFSHGAETVKVIPTFTEEDWG